jgi:dephospho-CoA kinase
LLKVGLTGGIASGKSVVADMLAARGVHVLRADELAHSLMEPGQPVYNKVVEHFGRDILGPDRRIDRKKLAEKAFGNTPSGGRVEELNRIVHPAVIRRQEQWMDEIGRADPQAIAVVEAALIVEAGVAGHFDRIILVTCRPEQRVDRFAKRLGLERHAAETEVARRMAAQMADEQKRAAAHYIIDNSGSLADTEKQVEKLYRELRAQT